MRRSLFFDCQRENQPAAVDPLERATWAALRIRAGTKLITRLFDRETEEPRDAVYVPTFPLARWMVANWWTLFHEPLTFDEPPLSGRALAAQQAWIRRHCLRAADAGLLLPRTFLYSDGRAVRVRSQADPEDAFPTMPGYFQLEADEIVERGDAEAALGEFVGTVLHWLRGTNDPRVDRLKAGWESIAAADEAERAFCRASARMGLDPYTSEEWNPDLLNLIESQIGENPDVPLVEDALESASPTNAVEVWSWVTSARSAFDLGRAPFRLPFQLAPVIRSGFAAPQGYGKAASLRQSLSLSEDQPLGQVSGAADALGIGPMQIERRDPPAPTIQGAVGWRNGKGPTFAGAAPRREQNRRFLEARAMYLAAFGCNESARLVTGAKTWDQQASRAFAAELLIPRSTVGHRLAGAADEEEFARRAEELSKKFAVSHWVVEMQWKNAAWLPLNDRSAVDSR